MPYVTPRRSYYPPKKRRKYTPGRARKTKRIVRQTILQQAEKLNFLPFGKTGGAFTITSTGADHDTILTNIPQESATSASTDHVRHGNTCRCTGLVVKGSLAINILSKIEDNANLTGVTVRLVLYTPRLNAPLLASAGLKTNEFIDTAQYKVYYDRCHVLYPTGSPSVKHFMIKKNFTKGGRWAGLKCFWEPDGSVLAGKMTKNPIYVYYVSDASSGQNLPTCRINAISYFTDL